MPPLNQPHLFWNTAVNLESCADELESTEWGNLQWHNPDEEIASHKLREWCERYMTAYDYHHGDKPDE